jgi:hypothetical protein
MSDLTAISQTTLPDPPNPNTIPGGMDPDEIMVEVSLARYGVIQNDLTTQANEIKANNALLTDYQNTLAQVDKQISSDTSKDGPVTITVDGQMYNDIADAGIQINKASDVTGHFDPKTGMMSADTTTSITVNSGQQLAAWLKGKIQSLSNNSQMAMIELQSQMNNLNQTMQTATSILQKGSDTKDKILQNIH